MEILSKLLSLADFLSPFILILTISGIPIFLSIKSFRSQKMGKKTKIILGTILLIVPISFLSWVLFTFTRAVIIPTINQCPQEEKVFSFAGCSAKYTETTVKGSCEPCGGILPCISGFDQNKQIDILNCLCKSEKFDDAREFRTKYLNDDFGDTPCEKIPKKVGYL